MDDILSEGSQPSPLLLSQEEKRVLELYDKLQQLQLEIALITAQNDYEPSAPPNQDVESIQNDLLESRASYVLRNEVAESVVMANPLLQAVHGGTNASPIERDLLPVLTERDSTSIILAQQATSLKQINEETINIEGQRLHLSRQNVEIATEVLALAEQVNHNRTNPVQDSELAEETAQLEMDVKASRQRWRIMKATASAIVAGSGVNWAADERLRSMVLDEDDDGI